ncbi:enoyl-CoA hydratase [Motiliproteus sp. SC1-56]|uniref:enoyl-CoA hydratase n=1 Tax=Motiliproteus sp. SC1-56 TaxID=2799565 RepID=UPI001A8FA17C|nr:enoyl-CoA hydratase [Motiliproteus sp. SC1-56]
MSVSKNLEDRVLTLTLARPEKRNALTRAMYQTLADALKGAASDAGVRAVVITGTGDCFCSGNDIGDFIAAGEAGPGPALEFLHAIAAFPKPLLAAVRGPAVGIGTTLLLHCDLVYAGEGARFQLPFVNLGLVPEGGSSLLLPAMVGHARAAELLMLGEPFDAGTARELGLINGVLADDAVEARVQDQARKLAAKPPAALAQAKAMLKSQAGKPVAQVLDEEVAAFRERLTSPEAHEALMAFQQKRAPDFSAFE